MMMIYISCQEYIRNNSKTVDRNETINTINNADNLLPMEYYQKEEIGNGNNIIKGTDFLKSYVRRIARKG